MVCREASARQPTNEIWVERTPDPAGNGYSGADVPIAVGANARFPLVVGTRDTGIVPVGQTQSLSQFSFVKYWPGAVSQGQSQLTSQQYQWPTNLTKGGHKEVVAATFVQSVDGIGRVQGVRCYATGTYVSSSGLKRIVTIGVETDDNPLVYGDPSPINQVFGASESADGCIGDEVPVAIAADGDYVAVVGTSQASGSTWDLVVYVYNVGDATRVLPPIRWSSAGSYDDIPLGIAMTTSHWGSPAVAVAATVPDPSNPSLTSIVLLGWHLRNNILFDPSTFYPGMPLLPAYVHKNLTNSTTETDSDVGKGMASGSGLLGFAVLGTRYFINNSDPPPPAWHTDLVTELLRTSSFFIQGDPLPVGGYAGSFVEEWTRTWDRHDDDDPNHNPPIYVEDDEAASAICIRNVDTGGGLEKINITVTGTTKRPGIDPYPHIMFADYCADDGTEQFWGVWDPDPSFNEPEGEYGPMTVVGGQLFTGNQTTPGYYGVAVAGFAPLSAQNPTNHEYAAVAWSIPPWDHVVQHQLPNDIWAYRYPIPLVAGFNGQDSATAAFLGPVAVPPNYDSPACLFFTGISDSQYVSTDWITMRVQP